MHGVCASSLKIVLLMMRAIILIYFEGLLGPVDTASRQVLKWASMVHC